MLGSEARAAAVGGDAGSGTSATESARAHRLNADDADQMRSVYAAHSARLWWYVLGLSNGDSARAEDVCQETFLRAWRTRAVLGQTEPAARSWLFTVAKRIIIDEWRTSRARLEVVTDDLPETAVDDLTEHADTRSLVAAALGQLSREHREVLLECHLRGSSVTEASMKLGVPAGTVRSRTHYALRALKQAVEAMGVAQ